MTQSVGDRISAGSASRTTHILSACLQTMAGYRLTLHTVHVLALFFCSIYYARYSGHLNGLTPQSYFVLKDYSSVR